MGRCQTGKHGAGRTPFPKGCRLTWAEFDAQGPVRVFRNAKAAASSPAFGTDAARLADRAEAVRAIRERVWLRQEGECTRCPNRITWDSMHLHERVPRGRGGEISLENSEGLCAACHIGLAGVHGGRRPRFGEGKR